MVSIEDDDEKHVRRIRVTSEDGDKVQYPVSFRARLAVADGDRVEVGQQLTEGSVNPHEKLRVEGRAGAAAATWWKRSSRCTARRASRSTTSTSS